MTAVIVQAVQELTPVVGVAPACEALGVPRAAYYRRHRKSPEPGRPEPMPASQPRALSELERKELHRVLDSEEFMDDAPASVYAKLLDQGTYLASVSTMYRVLRSFGETGDRRRHATHPAHKKPELVATRPKEVWSWDITKLLGPVKWTYFYCYVIIDIFSRYVPGWMVAPAENGALAEAFIAETLAKQDVGADALTLHSDRGSPMTAKPVALLLADLGVTRSHSRPHVSNDNPYSESQFRTMKYRPTFPRNFGSIEDARSFCTSFFSWYNHEHRHSGIGFHTPADVHYGRATRVREERGLVLDAAYAEHPERFVRKAPEPPKLPEIAWINGPSCAEEGGLSTTQ